MKSGTVESVGIVSGHQKKKKKSETFPFTNKDPVFTQKHLSRLIDSM